MHYKVNRDGFAFAFTKIFFHFIHFILSFFLSSTIAPRGSLSQSLRSRVVCINVRSVSLAFASVFLFYNFIVDQATACTRSSIPAHFLLPLPFIVYVVVVLLFLFFFFFFCVSFLFCHGNRRRFIIVDDVVGGEGSGDAAENVHHHFSPLSSSAVCRLAIDDVAFAVVASLFPVYWLNIFKILSHINMVSPNNNNNHETYVPS